VFVFGDNDASSTGQAAAFGLAQRLKARGLTVEIEIPPGTDTDWNDVHRRKVRAGETKPV
jgi:putative DNA primase/helicase